MRPFFVISLGAALSACAASPKRLDVFHCESTLANGGQTVTERSYYRRTLEPAANRFTEEIVVDGGHAAGHRTVLRFAVDGNRLTLVDPSHTFRATGTLVGTRWAWERWSWRKQRIGGDQGPDADVQLRAVLSGDRLEFEAQYDVAGSAMTIATHCERVAPTAFPR
jgi:hypothetical protein